MFSLDLHFKIWHGHHTLNFKASAINPRPWPPGLRKSQKNLNPEPPKPKKIHWKIQTKITKKSKIQQKTQKSQIRNKSKQIISKSNTKSKSKADSIKMQRKWQKLQKSTFLKIGTLKPKKLDLGCCGAPLIRIREGEASQKKCLFWVHISSFSFNFLNFLSIVLNLNLILFLTLNPLT